MKIKKINASLLILAGLIVLSFAFWATAEEKNQTGNNIFLDSDQDGLTNEEEKLYGTNPNSSDTDGDGYSDGVEVKSGYDPTKPAPGDKLFSVDDFLGDELSDEDKENLTSQVVAKISQLTQESTGEENEDITLDQMQGLVDEVLNTDKSDEIMASLPEIKKSDLNIKEQNYKKLSDEEEKEKKKEDFASYITAVYYILASNSPHPITSSQDITTITTQLSQDIIKAITSRDTSSLENLNKSGEKIAEQLKEVTVPEELVDTHIKALQFAYYAKGLESYIKPNNQDPLKDITNLAKIQGFLSLLISFSEDTQNKFKEYGLTVDDPLIKEKLDDYGVEAPKGLELLQDLSK